jgi:amino acid transporter
MVIQTGSIALLGFVFGDYATELLGLGPHSSALYAAALVVALTVVNLWGVRQGKLTQNVLTAVEVAGVLAIVAAGLAVGGAAAPAPVAAAPVSGGAFGLVMVFVLLTFGGWNEAAYLSAEVRDPARTMVRVLVGGLLVVTVLYLAVNWAYLSALGLEGVAGSSAVAADVMRLALGDRGARLVSGLIAIAAITSANAAIFTGARTSFALGRDFPLLAYLARWDRRKGTPAGALVIQGAICLALVALGAGTRSGFETMVEYTAPVFWLFLFLTGVAVFVLRGREPDVARPFRVPLYPLTPALFCVTCAWLFYSSLAYTGRGALLGLAVLLAGVVPLVLSGRRSNSPSWRQSP